MSKFRQLRKRLSRRRDLTIWGDSPALPFTEEQAVVGPGLVGPAYVYADRYLNPR